MIPGTSYSPAKAFISFARDFFEALAVEDFRSALGKLDVSDKRWTKKDIISSLHNVIGENKICSTANFIQSASPELEQIESGYILHPVHDVYGDGNKLYLSRRK